MKQKNNLKSGYQVKLFQTFHFYVEDCLNII